MAWPMFKQQPQQAQPVASGSSMSTGSAMANDFLPGDNDGLPF